jgi:hypothetical protein
MPRGERNETWFPELVAELRQSWRADPTWEAVIDLRDQLQRRREHILGSRGIRPAPVRCLHCGHVGPGAPPATSVRAVLLALRRFGSSRRIASSSLTRSGLAIEHCFNWISMAEGQTAPLQLPTATGRDGSERPFLGAAEHRSRAASTRKIRRSRCLR